jgi:pilus assembly protein CpaB
MSRVQAVGFGAVAVLASAGATVLLGAVIGEYHSRLEAARRAPESVYVAVAARDLYPGVAIDEADLYAVQMQPQYVPEGAFLDPEYVVGRIARERVLANEVVRGERLADATSNQGLNVMVPRGLRALSVSIRDGAGLAGFLNPGNLVDVLVTVPVPDSEREETTTLLQAVYVLGVDSRMAGETVEEARARRGTHDPTVTLLVDPADAERVAHADYAGDLRLTMRTGDDAAVVQRVKAEAPRPAKARVAVAAPPELPACKEVWIWHGGARTVLLVDDHGKPAEPGTCASAR